MTQMKKRRLTGLLALCMLFGLTACRTAEPVSTKPTSTKPASTEPISAEPSATAEPSEAPEEEPVPSYTVTVMGSCGENAWWGYDESTQTLVIGGSGATEDYKVCEDGRIITGTTAPWSVYGNSIRAVVFEDGITHLGKYLFCSSSLTSISIPGSVTSIGERALAFCTGLTSVTIPNSVTSIEDNAFRGCTGLTDVYYTGTEAQWAAISISKGNDPLYSAVIHCSSPG